MWRSALLVGGLVVVLAAQTGAVAEDTTSLNSSPPSEFRLPETMRLNPVVPPSNGFTAPPLQSTINPTPFASLPPAREEHDSLVALGSFLVLGVVLVIGAWWLIQQVWQRRDGSESHRSLQQE